MTTGEVTPTGPRLTRGCVPSPLGDERLGQAEAIEHARDRVIHDVVEVAGPVVEGGHGRQHDGSHLGEGQQALEMADVQRRLAHQHDERAPSLSVTSAARAIRFSE